MRGGVVTDQREDLYKRAAAVETFWFPFSNYLCLAFMVVIISVMLAIPGIRNSVFAMPVRRS